MKRILAMFLLLIFPVLGMAQQRVRSRDIECPQYTKQGERDQYVYYLPSPRAIKTHKRPRKVTFRAFLNRYPLYK